MHSAKILIVDDNPGVLSAGRLLLKRHFAEVDTSQDPNEIPELLGEKKYDLVLLDMNFFRPKNTGQEGLFWLEKIKNIAPDTAVVLITAFGDVDLAVRAIKNGATDFVLKPWDNDRLLATLNAALKLKNTPTEPVFFEPVSPFGGNKNAVPAPADSQIFPKIIGKSRAIKDILATIDKVAPTDANILLTGENGTGKDLIAELIHSKSTRCAKNFVRVDLGGLPESLLESELFGHVKGAFTDAREDRAGRFEMADGGTIFLDEIGNLSLAAQAKLLTVLQNRTATRIDANRPRPVDLRVVAATNMPLAEAVKNRVFRQDLLYRINTIEIALPALRDRLEDIEPLAEHFLGIFSKKYDRKITGFSSACLKELARYSWPGNIRELQHAVERAVIMATGDRLLPADFFFQNSENRHSAGAPENSMNLETTEKQLIFKALEKHYGNITEAARELGLTRASLYRRLEKYQ